MSALQQGIQLSSPTRKAAYASVPAIIMIASERRRNDRAFPHVCDKFARLDPKRDHCRHHICVPSGLAALRPDQGVDRLIAQRPKEHLVAHLAIAATTLERTSYQAGCHQRRRG